MNPREKGRYLRERGWKSASLYGVRFWRDPLNWGGGGKTDTEAVRTQQQRERAACRKGGGS